LGFGIQTARAAAAAAAAIPCILRWH